MTDRIEVVTGEIQLIGTSEQEPFVLIRDAAGDALLAKGTATPTGAGFAAGGLFINSSEEGIGRLLINGGDGVAASFVPITPPAFDWTQFFGPSDDGFVFDGTLSRFFVNSDGPDGVTPVQCASSASDPVGWVEDLSGKGNNATQVSSPEKPVYYDDGGIRSIGAGFISGQYRNIVAPETGISAACTIYLIGSVGYDGNGSARMFTSPNYGTQLYITQQSAVRFSADNGITKYTSATIGGLLTVKIAKSGTGTNQTSLSAKVGSVSFTGMDTQLGTHGPGVVGASYDMRYIGERDMASSLSKYSFVFAINRVLSAGEQATVEAQILAAFSGWTP